MGLFGAGDQKHKPEDLLLITVNFMMLQRTVLEKGSVYETSTYLKSS